MYSLAFSKGCRAGSRLRCTLRTSCDRVWVHASSLLLITFTFIACRTPWGLLLDGPTAARHEEQVADARSKFRPIRL